MSETTSVVQALSAVMGDVQSVGKGDTNTQQGYKFRGVDAVVNAVGPALRKHGVVVVPVEVGHESEHYQSSKGTQMKAVTLTVKFRFYGPNGDYIEATACGESADSGDKAVPKAHSVAYRTLLLQALCIPTDDPEPDAQSNERAAQQNGNNPAKAKKMVARILELADQDTQQVRDAALSHFGTQLEELDEHELTLLGQDLRMWVENGRQDTFSVALF